MDPRFQSSFIPKKPVMTDMGKRRAPINLISLIVTVVFIVALAATGAVFFYQNYLNGRIASDQQSLGLTQGQFDPSTIDQIIRLDTRINTATAILSGHVALSNLFAALQTTTLQTVRFSNFNFSTGDQNTLVLNMSGEALGFSDVALQSAAFNRTSYFKNIIISGLSVEQNGAVTFNLSMSVDPSLVVYAPQSGAAAVTAPVTQSAPVVTQPVTVASSTPVVAPIIKPLPVATTTATSTNSTHK